MQPRAGLAMNILALEFSSSQRSVAVVQSDARRAGLGIAEVIESGGKSGHPFQMIDECLHQARIEREQIDCLAIGLGPGSYHGIRSAISIAQGWSLASVRVRLLGISTVDCLVRQVQQDGIRGRLNLAIDAQRNEFYLTVYDVRNTDATELESLHLASEVEVQERITAGQPIAGPDLSSRFPKALNLFPRAAALGQLAIGSTDFISGDKLEPIYLRQTAFVKAPPPKTRFE